VILDFRPRLAAVTCCQARCSNYDRSSSSVPSATPRWTRLLIFEGLLIRPGESFGANSRGPGGDRAGLGRLGG
jgi:hypothetical protein